MTYQNCCLIGIFVSVYRILVYIILPYLKLVTFSNFNLSYS